MLTDCLFMLQPKVKVTAMVDAARIVSSRSDQMKSGDYQVITLETQDAGLVGCLLLVACREFYCLSSRQIDKSISIADFFPSKFCTAAAAVCCCY